VLYLSLRDSSTGPLAPRAELPWKSVAPPVPDKEYIAILTYLPVTSFWMLPQFFYYTGRIRSQLKSAPGLIGYSGCSRGSEKILDVIGLGRRAYFGALRSPTTGSACHDGFAWLHGRYRVHALENQGFRSPAELARGHGTLAKERVYRFYGIAPE